MRLELGEYKYHTKIEKKMIEVLENLDFIPIEHDENRLVIAYFDPSLPHDSVLQVSAIMNTIVAQAGLKCPVYLIPTCVKIDITSFKHFVGNISDDERALLKASIEMFENNSNLQ